ncbi:MAG: metal ABC transporter permease [Acidobacteriota bacterium]
MSFFADIAGNPFLWTGLVAGWLASVACGVIGPYVVTRRLVFLGGAVAHIAVGGLGLAIYLRHRFGATFSWLEPLHGALLVSLLAALLLARVDPAHRGRGTDSDTWIGALWATGMAAGILLIKLTPGYHAELMSYLFGNLAFVDWPSVWLMLGLDVVIVAVALAYHKRFLALCLDAEHLRLQGFSVTRVHAVLLMLIALTVITLTQVVGLILVIALLSLPAAIAGRVTRRLAPMIGLSIALSLVFTTAPRLAVYGSAISPEPAIVLTAGFCYAAVLLIARLRRSA